MRKYIIFVFLTLFSVFYLSSCGHEHNYVESNKTEATCTNPGSITYTCECGESYQDSIEPLGHKFKVIEGKEATCTTDGYAEYQECERCNHTESEQVIKALGHDYKFTDVAPTCEEKGYTEHVCNRCGDSYKDAYIDALGHEYVNHTGVAATCLESGYKDYQTCANCDYTTYEEIEALGHDLVHHDKVHADCVTKGHEAYDECSICDYTTYVEIEAYGHNYTWSLINPTCTETGYKRYLCQSCGDTYDEEDAPAYGHYLLYENAVSPTCTSVGHNAYEYCGNCDYTTYEEIPMTEHIPSGTYESVEGGHRTYCNSCGYEFEVEVHTIEDGLCTVCGFNDTAQYLTIIFDEETQKYILTKCDTSVTHVYIPNHVNVIKDHAFDDCDELVYINIPTSVTEIQYAAFSNCDKLKELTIPGSVEKINSMYGSGIEKLILLEGVKEITTNAFYNYPPKEVYLPKSLEKICEGNFEGEHFVSEYSQLKIYYAGDLYDWMNIEMEEYSAVNTKEFYVMNEETGKYEQPTEFVVPADMIDVEIIALAGIKSLETIVFHENVKSIGERVFTYCSGIKEIVLPEGIETIGDYAFSNCTSLEKMNFPQSLQYIGQASLSGAKFKTLRLPFIGGSRGINTHFWYIFGNANFYPNTVEFDTVFEEVVIYDISDIYGGAFNGCSGIKNLVFEKEITSVERPEYAFSGMDSLESNVYKNGVYVGTEANPYQIFVKPVNNEITELEVYKDVKYFIYNELAELDGKLEKLSIPFPSYTADAESEDKYLALLFDKKDNNLISPVLKELTFTGNIDGIYMLNLNVEKLIIEDSKVLPQFWNAKNLHTVVLPEGLEQIPRLAFDECSALKNINIPESVKKIDYNAFENCTALEELVIPGKSTQIGENIVKGCTNLKKITLPYISSANSDNENFYGILNYMPVEIANNLEELTLLYGNVVKGGLKQCTSLKKLTVPYVGDNDTNTYFGYAFNALDYLTQADFVPASLTEVVILDASSIKENSFYGLENIISITLENNLVNLPANSLVGLDSVKYNEKDGAYYLGSSTNPYAILVGFVNNEVEEFEFLSDTIAIYESCMENVSINKFILNIDQIELFTDIQSENIHTLKLVGNEENNTLNKSFGSNVSNIDTLEIENITAFASDVFKEVNPVNTVNYLGDLEDWMNLNFENLYSTPAIIANKVLIDNELIESINLEDKAIEKNYIFAGWKNIKSLQLNDFSYFVETAFEECTISEYIGIPSKLKLLETKYLKSITLTGERTSLSKELFEGITELDYLAFDNNINYIYEDTFEDFTSIKKFNFLGTLTDWQLVGFDSVEANPTYYSNNMYVNGEEVTSINFAEEGITYIARYHYSYLTNLKSIDITGVTGIYNEAFRGSGITSLALPDSDISISSEAFAESDLVEFSSGDYLEQLPYGLLSGCDKLKKVYLGKNISSFNGQVLLGTSIEEITVHPENEKFTVEDNCLVGYEDEVKIVDGSLVPTGNTLKTVYLVVSADGSIPSDIEYIFYYAYSACNNVKEIIIPESVKYIDSNSLNGLNSLEKLTFPHMNIVDGITTPLRVSTMFNYDFDNELEIEVLSGDSVPDSFFENCDFVTKFILPDTITTIGESAFRNCSFEEFDFTNIISIDRFAFRECKNLKSVNLPETCTNLSVQIFQDCTSLEEISTYVLPNGILHEFFGYVDEYAPQPENSYVVEKSNEYYVPLSFTKLTYYGSNIDYKAFYNFSSLEEIIIKNDITRINESAFAGLENLNILVFEGNIGDIQKNILTNTNNLKTIVIKGTITGLIDSAAFTDYTALELFVIEKGCDQYSINIIHSINTNMIVCTYNYAGVTSNNWDSSISNNIYIHTDSGRKIRVWEYDTDGFTPIIVAN